MGCKAFFIANSTAIGNKNNAADRPSLADRRPEGVMQGVPGYLGHSAQSRSGWLTLDAN